MSETFFFATVTTWTNQPMTGIKRLISHVFGNNFFDRDYTITQVPLKEKEIIFDLVSKFYFIQNVSFSKEFFQRFFMVLSTR